MPGMKHHVFRVWCTCPISHPKVRVEERIGNAVRQRCSDAVADAEFGWQLCPHWSYKDFACAILRLSFLHLAFLNRPPSVHPMPPGACLSQFKPVQIQARWRLSLGSFIVWSLCRTSKQMRGESHPFYSRRSAESVCWFYWLSRRHSDACDTATFAGCHTMKSSSLGIFAASAFSALGCHGTLSSACPGRHALWDLRLGTKLIGPD